MLNSDKMLTLGINVFVSVKEQNARNCFKLYNYMPHEDATLDFIALFVLASPNAIKLAYRFVADMPEFKEIDLGEAKGIINTIRYYIFSAVGDEEFDTLYKAMLRDTDDYNQFIAHIAIIGRDILNSCNN